MISTSMLAGRSRAELHPTKVKVPTRLPNRQQSAIRQLPTAADLPYRVLLIAGENVHSQLIRMILLNSDMRISSAQTTVDAAVAITAELPHLVLVDWDIEGIDGRAVLRAIKTNQETRKMPVLVMTNRPVTETLKLELGIYGVQWVLEKPIVPLSLPKLILKIISGASVEQTGAVFQRKAALIACGQTASGALWKSIH